MESNEKNQKMSNFFRIVRYFSEPYVLIRDGVMMETNIKITCSNKSILFPTASDNC